MFNVPELAIVLFGIDIGHDGGGCLCVELCVRKVFDHVP